MRYEYIQVKLDKNNYALNADMESQSSKSKINNRARDR